jgi:hypothetical protein
MNVDDRRGRAGASLPNARSMLDAAGDSRVDG